MECGFPIPGHILFFSVLVEIFSAHRPVKLHDVPLHKPKPQGISVFVLNKLNDIFHRVHVLKCGQVNAVLLAVALRLHPGFWGLEQHVLVLGGAGGQTAQCCGRTCIIRPAFQYDFLYFFTAKTALILVKLSYPSGKKQKQKNKPNKSANEENFTWVEFLKLDRFLLLD